MLEVVSNYKWVFKVKYRKFKIISHLDYEAHMNIQ